MRYIILDSLLEWGSVFLVGLIVTWLLNSCYEVGVAWWQEARQDLQVDILDHDDPRLTNIKKGDVWHN